MGKGKKTYGYRQIADVLIAEIVKSRFSGGKRFPSRHEIAEFFSVAGQTAQRTLKLLEKMNWISCCPGRRARVVFPVPSFSAGTRYAPLTFLMIRLDPPEPDPWWTEVSARLKKLICQSGNKVKELPFSHFLFPGRFPGKDGVCLIPVFREIAPELYRITGEGRNHICGCSLTAGPGTPLCVSLHSCLTDMTLFLIQHGVKSLTIFSSAENLFFRTLINRILMETLRDFSYPLRIFHESMASRSECSFRELVGKKIRESRDGFSGAPPALLFFDPFHAEFCFRSAGKAGWKSERDYFLIGCCAEAEKPLRYSVIDLALDSFCRTFIRIGCEAAGVPQRMGGVPYMSGIHVPRFRTPDSMSL